MSERIYWSLNRPYGWDDNFNFRYGEAGQKALIPCQPIQDKGLCLGIVGNSHLRPDQLMVLDRDRSIIKVTIEGSGETVELSLPGKSALIVLEPNICDRELLTHIVRTDLSGNPDRHDHLYAAKIAEIETTDWVAYWAPLQLSHKLTHVRLVARRTIERGEDPTIEDAQKLIDVFSKVS